MKIACQSCQAKYTIADEKVVGKVVKIRCKKCGATIVVNGQDDGSREEKTEIRSSGLGPAADEAPVDEWIVNYGDNDQRTMTTGQIIAEFSTGALSDETYCWRDGMGDWLPLREIGELAAACGLTVVSDFARQPEPVAREPEPYEPAAAAPGRISQPGAPAAAGGGPLASIFGSSPAPAPAAGFPAPGSQQDAGAAVARRAGGRGAGADLFGAAASAGSESDVMTSAPQNPTASGDGKLTGQRNENSVLFSLSTLTANAQKKGPDVGAVNEDGSGLIDIRALSSAMASSGGPKKASHADDIMNLGGGGAFSAPLAAPVLTAALSDPGDPSAPATAASNTKLYAMFGGLAVLLIGGMVAMFFALRPPAGPLAQTAPTGSGVAAPGGSGAAGSTPAAASAPAPSATAPEAPVAAADTSPKAAAPSVGVGKRNTGAGAGPGPAAAAPAAPPPFAQATPAPAAAPGSLDQAITGSVKNAPPPPAPAAPAAGGAAFDRGAAAAALGGIADSASSCKKPGGPTGEGHVSITFSPSGSVLSAIVDQPPYAGTAVGGCVAGKFRGAHVPAFSGGNLTIGKRFTIN
jgi:predicted Zn finger-like uncharacterized protein